MKRFLAAAGLLTLALACTLPARADEYSYHRTVDSTVEAGGAATLAVTGYNGNIRLYGDSGSTVRVHAVLGARSAGALRDLQVQSSRQGDAVRIQEVCPGTRRFFFWSFQDCDVELEVHYPRALAVNLLSQNGNVDVNDPAGTLKVTNANGDLTVVNAASDLSLSNQHGDLDASLASNWRGSSISMHTSAGDVDLRVPKGFRATFNASVRFGEVSNKANLEKGPVTLDMRATFGDVTVSRE